jgi:hydroxyacylglutathione hydrolase
MAIDPVDHHRCLAAAEKRGWRITQIVNTHEHGDHVAGNAAMIAATGAKLLAPGNAGQKIKNVDRGLKDGDMVNVGTSVELIVLDTPGHTMCHLALLSTAQPPVLLSGDVLFNAGVGNCHNGGDPQVLFQTIETKIQHLTDETRVYPGHEYLLNNLAFSLDREPDNPQVKKLLAQLGESYDPDEPLVTTIGLERAINPFLRLGSKTLVDRLRESFPDMPATRQDVFLRLRQLRDRW